MSDRFKSTDFGQYLSNGHRLISAIPDTCFIGKLYYVTASRNAWNRGRFSYYLGENSFHLTLPGIQVAVERSRRQGSRWSIVELPCCVFVAGDLSLLVTQIGARIPLSNYTLHGSLTGHSVGEIANSFVCPSGTIIRLVGPTLGVSRLDGALRRYLSYSLGGGRSLEWHEIGSDYHNRQCDRSHVIRLIEQGRNLLRPPPPPS